MLKEQIKLKELGEESIMSLRKANMATGLPVDAAHKLAIRKFELDGLSAA